MTILAYSLKEQKVYTVKLFSQTRVGSILRIDKRKFKVSEILLRPNHTLSVLNGDFL